MSPLRKGHLDIITFATFTKAQFKEELAQFASKKKTFEELGKRWREEAEWKGVGSPIMVSFWALGVFVLFFFINR